MTPTGDIVATAERGTMMGNRGGRLHRDDRSLGRARWKSKAWIACRVEFRGRHRPVMGAGYTELFFLDEATALAAGHRPCFECRRGDALAFAEAWAQAHGITGRARAGDMDQALHNQRRASGGAPVTADIASLADGAMIENGGGIWLVTGDNLMLWSHGGYSRVLPKPRTGRATLVTPPAIAAVLAAGYRPALHPSARNAPA